MANSARTLTLHGPEFCCRLFARLPCFSHISTFMINQLHWLSVASRIQCKMLFLVSWAQQVSLWSNAQTNLYVLPPSPSLVLFLARTRTDMAQHRDFVIVDSSFRNGLCLQYDLRFCLGTSLYMADPWWHFFPRSSHVESVSELLPLSRGALQLSRYNTINTDTSKARSAQCSVGI